MMAKAKIGNFSGCIIGCTTCMLELDGYQFPRLRTDDLEQRRCGLLKSTKNILGVLEGVQKTLEDGIKLPGEQQNLDVLGH